MFEAVINWPSDEKKGNSVAAVLAFWAFFFCLVRVGEVDGGGLVVARTNLFYILVWCSAMCSVLVLEISLYFWGRFSLPSCRQSQASDYRWTALSI